MTIGEVLKFATNKLQKTSTSPALDSEVLLSHTIRKDRAWIFANPDFELSDILYSQFQILVRRRANHWPIAYLTGHKEFFGLDFRVTPDVLIPRPETELLVERAIQILQTTNYKLPTTLIDVGTGSGCIIVSISRHCESAKGRRGNLKFYATDISKAALRIAKLNAKRHGVSNKIKFKNCDLIENSLILANLPYLTPQQYNSNPDLKYEPRSALVAGKDGLKYYRELFSQLSVIARSQQTTKQSRDRHGLRPRDDRNLIILLEHDPSQKQKLANLAKKYFPSGRIEFHKDLTNRYRICQIF